MRHDGGQDTPESLCNCQKPILNLLFALFKSRFFIRPGSELLDRNGNHVEFQDCFHCVAESALCHYLDIANLFVISSNECDSLNPGKKSFQGKRGEILEYRHEI